MGDTVARRREPQPVPVGEGTQIAMILHVLVVDLEDVVVGVDDAQRNRNRLRVEHLELEGGHGGRGVLQQDLVDGDTDVSARGELAINMVLSQNPVGQWLGHRVTGRI